MGDTVVTDEASYETTTGEAGRSTEVRAGSVPLKRACHLAKPRLKG